jgi:hypothetical protein
VRVCAKIFDGERDEEGRLFSEKWEQDGNGEWCYGTISHVYRKKGRQPQNYSGYRGTVLHMQYHSTAAVPDFFFSSQVTKKL